MTLGRIVALLSAMTVIFLIPFYGSRMPLTSPTGLLPSAHAAPVDSTLIEAIATSESGQARFFVIMNARANLSRAKEIDDWAARGQFV
ncbi:MAG: hypothetical protein U9R25_00465 [Chloroflexota bacterium]|nr:hypothetical protein [Chloroflexota bacterium]